MCGNLGENNRDTDVNVCFKAVSAIDGCPFKQGSIVLLKQSNVSGYI